MSTMKGSRATSVTPEGSPEGVDLSLTGLPLPMSRRPSSASTAKPVTRSISVATGGTMRRRALEATGPGGSRAINNLRRSNSTTQVNQPWTSCPRPAEPTDFLALFEGDPGGRGRLASLPKPCSGKGATWNVLDDQPRGFGLPASAQSPSTLNSPGGPRRRECALAPSFTANNRSSKGAVGNCVTSMVHNHYAPVGRAPPLKSSNHTAPALNNIIKAATNEGSEGSSFRKPHKNFSTDRAARGAAGGTTTNLLRQKEVTEEEAERFIHQVNQAAVTIQRWYRHQVQRRKAGVTDLEHLQAATQEGQQQQLGSGNLLDLHRQKEAARKKAREEKARQARQAAIQELRQKRAQQSGKAEHGLPKGSPETRAPGQPRPSQEPPLTPGSDARQPLKANSTGTTVHPTGPRNPCLPASDSSSEHQPSPEDKPQDMASEVVEMVGPTRSRVKSRETLDELLDTLRLLEEDPKPLSHPRVYHKDRHAWMDEDSASSLTADNLERWGKLGAPCSTPEEGALLSEAKLRGVRSFLDEMERSGQGQPARQQEAQQCDLTVRRVKETEKELRRQLRQQKEHYEATIQRHLSFIDQVEYPEGQPPRVHMHTRSCMDRVALGDRPPAGVGTLVQSLTPASQLIEDKKVLNEKCEAVVAELKQGDQRCRERVAQMQEQHELEIKKLKELMSATEKVRREKWINEKTKKIKEITVRGLEPEIQKLIAKHKQELRRLRGLHEAELLQRDEQAAQRYLRQAEDLREHLEREKEALGQQERERAQRRFEQHLEQEQQALEQQRRRLYSEVAEERERLSQQAARQRAELEELRQQLEDSSSALTRALRTEFEKGQEEQERRHQVELKALKDQLEVERQAWTASCAKKEEAWQLNRERELKEEIRKDRDQEIELVIHRLEADMTLAKEESERAMESRSRAHRRGSPVHHLPCLQVNSELSRERGSLVEVVRQEFADRLAASEEENQRVRAELAELQARQQLELDEVHQRVKTALARKEKAVSSLRRQHEAAMKRADHLEELLEQHRRPPLSAK
ncbi:centrosomal protein of 131 kDa isoform X2 [Marmota marmota marmota]|uniref:centrosomal protein of 131 kDa isoform X2 n=1 Tax=Marmota marmota marmota TaxID=9994 RepID=UPI002091E7F1|nr:centrosomal protein of 131 kDa isoform X2 [Marmota marmota marmota]